MFKTFINVLQQLVDLDVLVELTFPPQHRVVEEVVAECMKATVESQRVTDVDDVLSIR